MSHAINAWELANEVSALLPPLDLTRCHASCKEFRTSDNPVASVRQGRTDFLDRGRSTTHAVVEAPRFPISPPGSPVASGPWATT